MNLDEVVGQSCRIKRGAMIYRVDVPSLILGIFFSAFVLPTANTLPASDGEVISDLESVYNVTTSVMDEVKESIFTIKLKCRFRTSDIRSCSLYDPQYQTTFYKSPCENSSLCRTAHLKADDSYVGRFEIKERGSSVERLTVSSGTSLKQLTFYRIMANHLLPGVDVQGKPEGTFPLVEESVYGKCEVLVKVVRSQIKEDGPEEKRILKLVPVAQFIGSNKTSGNSSTSHQMLSIKRIRNLDSCYPLPGLLIFDAFFYHPMMVSVHYETKSSISRLIVSDRAFTSYTTEDIAMKDSKSGGNTTMLHVRTTVTLHSVNSAENKIPRISYPVSVELPFVGGFDPADPSNANSNKTHQ